MASRWSWDRGWQTLVEDRTLLGCAILTHASQFARGYGCLSSQEQYCSDLFGGSSHDPPVLPNFSLYFKHALPRPDLHNPPSSSSASSAASVASAAAVGEAATSAGLSSNDFKSDGNSSSTVPLLTDALPSVFVATATFETTVSEDGLLLRLHERVKANEDQTPPVTKFSEDGLLLRLDERKKTYDNSAQLDLLEQQGALCLSFQGAISERSRDRATTSGKQEEEAQAFRAGILSTRLNIFGMSFVVYLSDTRRFYATTKHKRFGLMVFQLYSGFILCLHKGSAHAIASKVDALAVKWMEAL